MRHVFAVQVSNCIRHLNENFASVVLGDAPFSFQLVVEVAISYQLKEDEHFGLGVDHLMNLEDIWVVQLVQEIYFRREHIITGRLDGRHLFFVHNLQREYFARRLFSDLFDDGKGPRAELFAKFILGQDVVPVLIEDIFLNLHELEVDELVLSLAIVLRHAPGKSNGGTVTKDLLVAFSNGHSVEESSVLTLVFDVKYFDRVGALIHLTGDDAVMT
mmetsp:Transcript_37100/g.54544  ORF Transcript_37100/g.54544 Transcript_37100/m.54544 type:complete len:216 (-) Transcript_37100:316-963(-)